MAREFFARCGVRTPIANGCLVYSSNGCLIGCTPPAPAVIIADSGLNSSVRCASFNSAGGTFSGVLSGRSNTARADYATVTGGATNCSCSTYGYIGGGRENLICSTSTTAGVITGGTANTLSGYNSFIGGGFGNTVSGCYNTIAGGFGNQTLSTYNFVGGGKTNCASGSFATVLGGCCTVASGSYSGAFGCGLTASCACTWYTNNACSCGTIASSCLTSNQVLCAGAGGVIQSTNWGYGSFSSSACQPIACTTLAYAMTFDCVEIANGVALQCSSQLRVLQSGVYNLAFSAQVIHAAGGDASASIWFKCNGCIIPRSNTDVTINGNNSAYVAAWNFMTCMNTNDYLEIYWRASDTDVSLLSCAAQVSPTRPATSSLIATLNRVF